ncbi:flagellar basal body-associated protein FliL [Massilia sp. LXY-6]|uniref:flagellar basal body-associated protein FliL n=1 Tax=Massilia sp. LXY-6 TaxID=3379823 RepID=UPI003EDED7D7
MKADPKAEAAAPAAGGKNKLFMMIGAAVLVLGLGGGAGWYFMHGSGGAEASGPAKKDHGSSKKKKEAPPEYLAIEPFTVNLQPENGDQYLQVAFSLQVGGTEQVELIKTNMAKVRSRVLLLLSGKKASEINTVEGKQQLAGEILAVVKQPFSEHGEEQEVSDVLFTSFIIQ